MKKNSNILIMILFALFSFAASAGTGKSTEKAASEPLLGGEWNVTILVTDIHSHPISGALVHAPCTGQADKTTNSQGKAIWNGTDGCPCSNATAHVQGGGCDKNFTIKDCSATTTVSCP